MTWAAWQLYPRYRKIYKWALLGLNLTKFIKTICLMSGMTLAHITENDSYSWKCETCQKCVYMFVSCDRPFTQVTGIDTWNVYTEKYNCFKPLIRIQWLFLIWGMFRVSATEKRFWHNTHFTGTEQLQLKYLAVDAENVLIEE